MKINSFKPLAACYAALIVLVSVLWPSTVGAHGAEIDYTIESAVSLQAKYDGGGPMAEAQVTIYAPNEVETPWNTGKTDTEGRYIFTPDASIPGTWTVQVRQAGHGAVMNIVIGGDADGEDGTAVLAQGAQPGSTGLSGMQRGLMIACVLWGFAGTGLYFAGKKRS